MRRDLSMDPLQDRLEPRDCDGSRRAPGPRGTRIVIAFDLKVIADLGHQ